MPFGLKNAGVTFQRFMRKALGAQMGKNVEAYVDHLLLMIHWKLVTQVDYLVITLYGEILIIWTHSWNLIITGIYDLVRYQ
jgi:hypothetical protein